jgi:hypothetical protein
VRRGIYRLVHFPAGQHEELVVAWLWSERVGIVSHQTALALHELSAMRQALRRGLVIMDELGTVLRALEPFGTLRERLERF